jgi:hypothetical protein
MPVRRPPEPWDGFLTDLDQLLPQPVKLHCLGGFVGAMLYGFARPTADIDCLEVRPSDQAGRLLAFGGPGSPLHRKHRVYIQKVAIVTLPESYEIRLRELFLRSYERIRVYGLDPYDLALSKLERNSLVDRQDVAHLAKFVPLDRRVFNARYRQEMRPYLARPDREDLTVQLWLEEYFS